MKTFKRIFALIFTTIFICSCQKDEKIINEYTTYSVHVQRFSDKKPLKDCNLSLVEETWERDGRHYRDTMLMTSKTNQSGDASFKIKTTLIKNEPNVFYYVGIHKLSTDTLPDSTTNEWTVHGSCKLYHYGQTNPNPIVEASPLCSITIISDVNDWKKWGMDSLVIWNKPFSNFVMHYDNGNGGYDVQFIAECSAINTITYYYYSNGIKSKEYSKQIYVPFGSRDGDIIKLNLTF